MDTIRCRSCNVELNEDNWHLSYRIRPNKNRLCKSCSKKKSKEWKLKNPEKFKKISDRQNNKPAYKEYRRKHYNSLHGEKKLDRLRIIYKKFGFNPINEEFPCSTPHHTHLNDGEVIYIPSWLHQAVPHRHTSPESMHAINSWVLLWLIYGDKTETKMKFPKWIL